MEYIYFEGELKRIVDDLIQMFYEDSLKHGTTEYFDYNYAKLIDFEDEYEKFTQIIKDLYDLEVGYEKVEVIESDMNEKMQKAFNEILQKEGVEILRKIEDSFTVDIEIIKEEEDEEDE